MKYKSLLIAAALPLGLTAANINWVGASNGGDGSTWDTTWQNWDTTDAVPWDTTEHFAELGSNIVTLGDDVKMTGFNGSGTIDAGSVKKDLRIGGAGVTSTFSGTLGTNVKLVWDGASVLNLSGTNDSTQQAVLRNNGTLRLSSADAWKAGTKAKIELSTGTSNNKFTVELAAANEVFDRTTLGITTSDPAYLDTTVRFAAIGADRNIAYNGAGDRLNWGRGTERIGTLGLGNANSTHALNWTSDINLYGADRTVDVENSSVAVDAEISGAIESLAWEVDGGFGLTKTGAGTLKLSATNTYTGMTTVSEGNLQVTGSLAGGASVSDGATLSGDGTISGATTVLSGGTLAAGNSPGILTFGDALTLDAGSFTEMEIDGTVRVTDYDGIDVGGLLTYGGAMTLLADMLLAEGDVYDLFGINGTEDGSFASITLSGSAYGTGLAFALRLDAFAFGTTGETFTDTQLDAAVIPEPGTYALLAGCFALASVMIRRRR